MLYCRGFQGGRLQLLQPQRKNVIVPLSALVIIIILAVRKAVRLDDRPSTAVSNMAELIKGSSKRPNTLTGRNRPRPIDRFDMNESVIVPASESVLGISDHFASTRASKKKNVLKYQNQFKWKRENEIESSSKCSGNTNQVQKCICPFLKQGNESHCSMLLLTQLLKQKKIILML